MAKRKTVTAEVAPMREESKQVTIRKAEGGFIVSYEYGADRLDEVCKTLEECLACAEKHFGKKSSEEKDEE